MADKKKDNDEIRPLNNRVHIAGILAQLEEPKEGKGKDGVNYISLKGAVQCHPNDPAFTAFFSIYEKTKTAKGEENKGYKKIKEWTKTAVPMTEDKTNATFVDFSGSLTSNNYVAADGSLKETFVIKIKFVNDFKEYCYDLDIEGYINGIEDIEVDGVATGQKRLGLTSKDFFNNALIFNKKNKNNLLIAEGDIADSLDDANYEQGRTVSISCSRAKMEDATKPKKQGFGRQPVTSGSSIMYWQIIGGDEALDEDDDEALTKEQIRILTSSYNERNEEIVNQGYLGGKNSKPSGKKTGLGKKVKDNKEDTDGFSEVDEDEDDMPF